tara:strand:+ start:2698 stop:3309 length:612 start_codon:yes stop_codon:yes gene_type:complete
MARNDNPKKDREISFVRDIVSAFGERLDESKQAQLGIKQRALRSVTTTFDSGRAIMFTYTRPKGYLDNTLRYHHKFPVSIVMESDAKYVTGINLFYMPPRVRELVLERYLAEVNNPTNPNADSRTTLGYNQLAGTAFGVYVKPAVRKYLKDRASNVAVQFSPELWRDIFLGKTSQDLGRLWSRTAPQIVYKDYIRKVLRREDT